MKKILNLLVIFVTILVLFSCVNEKQLTTPQNFKIIDTVASWDSVENATKYRLNLEKDGTSMKRIVNETQIDLNDLDLDPGTYIINVQAVGNGTNDSLYTTNNLEYVQKDLNVVNELKENNLLDSLYVKWNGRTLYNEEKKLNMVYHSASGFEIKFVGSKLTTRLYATNYNNPSYRPYVVVVFDDDFDNMIRTPLTQKYTDFVLAEGINDGLEHKVTLYKSTESIDSHIGVESITTDGKFISGIDIKERKIEFIAASSSTGYGNLGSPSENKTSANSDCMQGFAAISARKLNADFQIFSASGWGVKASIYANAGENLFDAYKNYDFRGEAKNISYTFNLFTPDVIVVNLGTNDYSYANQAGITDTEKLARLEAFKTQYMAFIEYLHAIYPNAHIVLFYGLMNENKAIIDATNEMYEILLPKVVNLSQIKVSGDAQGCAYHPSVASHKAVANLLVNHIKSKLGW